MTFRDPFSAHGEELVRSRIGTGVTRSPFTWPQAAVYSENWRDAQTLIAKVDGVVAGRAVLELWTYPFAELANLEVMPACQRRGVGSRLVAEAVRRASDKGFLALHIQTDLDNRDSQSLHARHGFLPATQGEMLRMVRFLNYPALSHFLWEHPLALFQSRRGEEVDGSLWELSWTDPVSADTLSIGLSGGSCQFDSNEFGPAVKTFQIRAAEFHLQSSISGPAEVSKHQAFDLVVEVANTGSKKTEGACRLLLNPGFAAAAGTQGAVEFSVKPGASEKLTLPAQVLESFDDQLWKACSYPSVSVGVEFFVDDYIFWLSHQVKVEPRG